MATKKQLRRKRRRLTEGNSPQPFFKAEHEQSGSSSEFFFSPAVHTVQPKLTVSQPGDPHELEADRMAEKMSNGQATLPVQRTEQKEDDEVSRLPQDEPEQVSKKEHEDDEEKTSIAAKSAFNATPAVSASAAQKILHSRGTGSPLPEHVRQEMSSHFGYDFNNVRIHTDYQAEHLSDDIRAQAFTHGNDIYFNKAKYSPETPSGKKLLAHELTHVVQQSRENELQRVQRQQVPGISTPVPDDFEIAMNARQRVTRATGIINGVSVTINRDTTGRVPRGSSGETRSGLSWRTPSIRTRNRVVTAVIGSPRLTLTIRTTYRRGVDPGAPSAYGRGTTPPDRNAGNTTLRFHEGSHGTSAMDFVRNNPLPRFTGVAGMRVAAYRQAVRRYNREMRAYQSRLRQANIRAVDCTGIPAAFCAP